MSETPSRAPEAETVSASVQSTLALLDRATVATVSLLLLLVIATALASSESWAIVSLAFFPTSVAALAAGVALGFLFAHPKSGSRSRGPEDGSDASSVPDVALNQGLGDITDWMTKMIVGIGLSQIFLLDDYLWKLAGLVGEDPYRSLIGFSILIFGSLGFLQGYLRTRLILAEDIIKADSKTLGAAQGIERELKRLRGQLAQYQGEKQRDERAEQMVSDFLDVREEVEEVPEERIVDTISGASQLTRNKVFRAARDFQNQVYGSYPTELGRVVPFFRGLIRGDREGRYPQNHAQLGFALRDLTLATGATRDELHDGLQDALHEIERAIAVRARHRTGRHRHYELERWLTLALLHDFDERQPTLEDLEEAVRTLPDALPELERRLGELRDTKLVGYQKVVEEPWILRALPEHLTALKQRLEELGEDEPEI